VNSNDITAIPQVWEDVYFAECSVTLEALGCQTAIAQKIIAKQADYALSLKGNHGQRHADVVDWAQPHNWRDMPMPTLKRSTKIMDALRCGRLGR
jgi:predicted transposase YbfD/YdcC